MKQLLRKLDLRDALLVIGLVSLLGGIAHFSPAVAAITFGLLCLFTALRPSKRSAQVANTTERQS